MHVFTELQHVQNIQKSNKNILTFLISPLHVPVYMQFGKICKYLYMHIAYGVIIQTEVDAE